MVKEPGRERARMHHPPKWRKGEKPTGNSCLSARTKFNSFKEPVTAARNAGTGNGL